MPIANKLSTLKKCLTEVLKYGGGLSPRDLYPYQLALSHIDAIRDDGKFKGRDGSVPEGQAILNANLCEWSVRTLTRHDHAFLLGHAEYLTFKSYLVDSHELLNTLRESMEQVEQG